MTKKASVYVLLLVTLSVVLTHVSYRQKDNGLLFVVDEREIDIVGMFREKWGKLRRHCDRVTPLYPSSDQHQTIQRLIQDYSPPGSASAHIRSLQTMETWSLAAVEFENLLPAVVLIEHSDGVPTIVSHAIWSGYTHPWQPAPYIRDYISGKAPHVATELFDCFEPGSRFFSP